MGSIIVGAIVFAAFGAVIYSLYRKKKKTGRFMGCSGCSGCSERYNCNNKK